MFSLSEINPIVFSIDSVDKIVENHGKINVYGTLTNNKIDICRSDILRYCLGEILGEKISKKW